MSEEYDDNPTRYLRKEIPKKLFPEEEYYEFEFDGDDGQLKEKEFERNDEDEPRWTEVQGSSSFYCICPICGSMIPGAGPKIDCSDGVGRFPKDLHEWWHRMVQCDWYQD